jgi:hypothetical protein
MADWSGCIDNARPSRRALSFLCGAHGASRNADVVAATGKADDLRNIVSGRVRDDGKIVLQTPAARGPDLDTDVRGFAHRAIPRIAPASVRLLGD